MPRHEPVSDAERAELRGLFLAARGGTWEARVLDVGHCHLYAVLPDGARYLVAMPNGEAETRLMASARNALPRLFAEIDELRKREAPRRTIPIRGTVG